MLELVARAADGTEKWRYAMLEGTPITLGREAGQSQWVTAWDTRISRLHAELTGRAGTLHVRKLPSGRNPIVFRGEKVEEFDVCAGEGFVIGETTFDLEEKAPTPSSGDIAPLAEMTCTPHELQQVAYANASDLIQVLGDLFKAGSSLTDQELETRIVEVLKRGIPNSQSAALVHLVPDSAAGSSRVEVRCRSGAVTLPSRRLVVEAIERRRQNRLHIWPPGKHGGEEYTAADGCDWAFCVPLPDDPLPGWGLYVTGQIIGSLRPGTRPPQEALKADVKFGELVANMFGTMRQSMELQRRQGFLSRFLPRPVMAAIAEQNIEDVLRPRQAEVTVLFCDLRGSCQVAEEGQENLQMLWDRVGGALDIMASAIIDQGGVIGDFQGDAAMGFWGWPISYPDAVERAATAALTIRRRFAQIAERPGHALSGLACGIGIASGPAFAGRLGTIDQFKVDVFGPTVNLAARLESMTKMFRVPILVDESCAEKLQRTQQPGQARCRRLARVRPYGMKKELVVSELLLPQGEFGAMPKQQFKDYEAALEAFTAGRWEDARQLLGRYPRDGATAFLTQFMSRHPQGPPAGWNGVIVMEGK
jgi:adenylate cyclase